MAPRAIPPIGYHFERDGQSYVVIATRPYVTTKVRPGRTVTLFEWQTACPTCDGLFVTSATHARPPATRRCKICRKPGLRVATERRKAGLTPGEPQSRGTQ